MTRPVLITGGAGFVGTNLADRLLSAGIPVLVLDDLSRKGVEENLGWLRSRHGERLEAQVADVGDVSAVQRAVRRASRVFHFAAQVAVTTSLRDPVRDFEVNARGTLNVLEAVRGLSRPIPVLLTSTNKVYGGFADLPLVQEERRYSPADGALRARGIDERRSLDFHSPYGCSKGAADQYVLDYARTYGIPAVVFRMSCIYGPHQFGNEDQGWVAHFLLQALEGRPLTIYGDGRQVRDVLFVDDLIEAMLLAGRHPERVAGQAYNIGGGPQNALSLLELLELIAHLHGGRPTIVFDEWRPGDQRYYVSDTSKFQRATGWAPRVDARQGVARLYHWLRTWRVRKAALPAAGAALGAAAAEAPRAAQPALAGK